MSTHDVIDSTNALVSTLAIIGRDRLATVTHARAAQGAAVITVATPIEARQLAHALNADYVVTAGRYGYETRHHAFARPVIIEAEGRPALPALSTHGTKSRSQVRH
ncbi:hypothetical protein [Cellulomonas olei]|uniref:hypothetical protein n=1 Tax=Cellulomonas sp. P4 TaxID=3142533 RepID=UPI0031BA3030